MSTKFSHASRASDRALFTGPIGNWLANGIRPVLISQTEDGWKIILNTRCNFNNGKMMSFYWNCLLFIDNRSRIQETVLSSLVTLKAVILTAFNVSNDDKTVFWTAFYISVSSLCPNWHPTCNSSTCNPELSWWLSCDLGQSAVAGIVLQLPTIAVWHRWAPALLCELGGPCVPTCTGTSGHQLFMVDANYYSLPGSSSAMMHCTAMNTATQNSTQKINVAPNSVS